MSSPIGTVSERVRIAIEAFSLLTGYMVIASPDLPRTIRISANLRLLEIRPGLNDDHIKECLEVALRRIGKSSAANFMSNKLFWADSSTATNPK